MVRVDLHARKRRDRAAHPIEKPFFFRFQQALASAVAVVHGRPVFGDAPVQAVSPAALNDLVQRAAAGDQGSIPVTDERAEPEQARGGALVVPDRRGLQDSVEVHRAGGSLGVGAEVGEEDLSVVLAHRPGQGLLAFERAPVVVRALLGQQQQVVQEPALMVHSPAGGFIGAQQPSHGLRIGQRQRQAGEVVHGVEAVVVDAREGAGVEVRLDHTSGAAPEPLRLHHPVDDRGPSGVQQGVRRRRRKRPPEVSQPGAEGARQRLAYPLPGGASVGESPARVLVQRQRPGPGVNIAGQCAQVGGRKRLTQPFNWFGKRLVQHASVDPVERRRPVAQPVADGEGVLAEVSEPDAPDPERARLRRKAVVLDGRREMRGGVVAIAGRDCGGAPQCQGAAPTSQEPVQRPPHLAGRQLALDRPGGPGQEHARIPAQVIRELLFGAEELEQEDDRAGSEAKRYELPGGRRESRAGAGRVVAEDDHVSGPGAGAQADGLVRKPALAGPQRQRAHAPAHPFAEQGGDQWRQVAARGAHADDRDPAGGRRPGGREPIRQQLEVLEALVESAEAARQPQQLRAELRGQGLEAGRGCLELGGDRAAVPAPARHEAGEPGDERPQVRLQPAQDPLLGGSERAPDRQGPRGAVQGAGPVPDRRRRPAPAKAGGRAAEVEPVAVQVVLRDLRHSGRQQIGVEQVAARGALDEQARESVDVVEQVDEQERRDLARAPCGRLAAGRGSRRGDRHRTARPRHAAAGSAGVAASTGSAAALSATATPPSLW